MDVLDNIWDWILGVGVSLFVLLVAGALLYKIGGFVVHKIIYNLVYTSRIRTWPKRDVEKRANTLASLSRTFWRIAVVVVLAGIIIRNLFPAVDLWAVLAGFGIVGVAVGFGAQSLVKDLFAGLFIISENQYRVGDRVELKWNAMDGAVGRVLEIGVRSTVLRDDDDNIHFLPNGAIVHVVNKSLHHQWDADS